MANYCADCGTYFELTMVDHADLEHNGYLFRGIENGDREEYYEEYG